MVECSLCGFNNQDEIVSHIRQAHEGGLKAYLSIFPDLPVVSSDIFTAIENAIYFGYVDKESPVLMIISHEEQEMLIVHDQNNRALRSEISIELDF